MAKISFKAFAGLRNDVSLERFGKSDLSVADNVDVDKTGRISRRAGYIRRITATAHSLWSEGALALFVDDTRLMLLSTGLVATPLGTVGNTRMDYSQSGERVYMSNGTVSRVLDNGVLRKWGTLVPALPIATITSGNLPAGKYQYTVTHGHADGRESGAMQAGVIDVATAQTITFTVAIPSDATVTHKNLYLTPPNGDLLYLVMTIPAALPTYTVYAADVADLTLPLVTQFLQPAPVGQLVAYYRGRMFVASGSILYMSEPFAYELFDLRNYIELDAPITLIAPLEDRPGTVAGMFMGTEKSCGILAGSGPSDFQYVPKVDYGAILGTAAYVEGTLIGEGKMGARQLPLWTTAQGICGGTSMMEVVNHTRGRYDFSAGNAVGAAMFRPLDNHYIVCASMGTLALRTENDAVSTYSNFSFNGMTHFNGMFLGALTGADGGIYELTGGTDNGALINASISLGTLDFDSAFEKSVERMYVGYQSATALEFKVTIDAPATYTYAMPAMDEVSVRGSRVKTGRGLNSRYWQFGLANTSGGDFLIDTIEISPAERQRRAHA